MKNSIKLLSLFLTAAFLVGCGSNNNGGDNKQSSQGGSEQQQSSQSGSKSSGKSSSSQSGGGEEEFVPVEHTHSWDNKWTSDPDYHWHACGGCVEVNDKAAHDWGSGTQTKAPGAYSVGEMTYTCSVCQRKKVEEIAATGGNETLGSFTFTDSELNTAQEIHTAKQKKYLNLGIEYYNITETQLKSCEVDGKQNVSTPNKVTVSWNYTAPSGKSVSKFQLLYGQRADLGDAYTVEGTTANTLSFYNPYLGDNYFKVIANLNDGSKEASEIKVFKVDTQAPRNLYAGNLPNVRDMGGRTTYAGGKIKQGLIYRGAGHNFDQKNTSVNSDGKSVILNQLKVKTEINVANGTSNNLGNSGVNVSNVVNAFMDYGQQQGSSGYPYSNLSRNAERIRQVMDVLADRSNYPIFYHCRIGTDRTGITGMMIGGLLGVRFNEVFQDYCFSNYAPIDGLRYPHKESDPNGDDPAKYIDEILAMPGATYQEQTYNALLSIGCKAETLNTIIDIMTEGPKADLSIKGKIGKGTSLTSTGTKKTDNEYKNPAVYYECSKGKETSLTAVTTAGTKDIVVYLGSSDGSNSTRFSDCVSLKIDGVTQTIDNSKTLFTAGFGITNQNRRTAYMFNFLGQYDLEEGQHTVTIAVKNGTFNIGTICIFDHVAAA